MNRYGIIINEIGMEVSSVASCFVFGWFFGPVDARETCVVLA